MGAMFFADMTFWWRCCGYVALLIARALVVEPSTAVKGERRPWRDPAKGGWSELVLACRAFMKRKKLPLLLPLLTDLGP